MSRELTPPRPPLALCVGVVGHAGSGADARAGVPTMAALFADIAKMTACIHEANTHAFDDARPQQVLISCLTTQSERAAAATAAGEGYRLRAVLIAPGSGASGPPLPEGPLASAECWFVPALTGGPAACEAAAAEALVAQSDLLVARVGSRPDARLAAVVEHAVRRGTPVIWAPGDREEPTQILWAGFDGLAPDRLDRASVPRRALAPETLRQVVAALVAPPTDPVEQAAIRRYFAERTPGRRWRPEYPLLLALAGVRVAPGDRSGWSRRGFRSPELPVSDPSDPGWAALNGAFAWADGLADHAAHDYRCGLIFNYVAAALAVLLALAGLLWPAAKPALLTAELVTIGLLIANTSLGSRAEWHRRWLDYRYLAEQLRPLRTLKALGAATPARQTAGVTGTSGRWTDWYARALWRQMGAPPSIADSLSLATLVIHIADEQVGFQIQYNEASAARLHQLDHRLHLLGDWLFYLTVAVGIVALAGTIGHSAWVHSNAKLLTVISAGLPTLGTAIFGIRGQADFVGAAGRCAETAQRLRALSAHLHAHRGDLILSCRTAENVAVTMLQDLTDWRTAYRHRRLAIPA